MGAAQQSAQVRTGREVLWLWSASYTSETRSRLIFCGPRIPPAGLERFQVYDVTQSEEFLRDNAELTAEGALFAAMRAQERALMDCACLVVGWGRIGRALTERLVALGARVTVASRSERGMRLAQSRGADAVETARLAEALPGKKLVFSTPPFPVLCGEALKSVDPDACLIDLASPPYGVDIETAHQMACAPGGNRACGALLPGKRSEGVGQSDRRNS